MQFDPVSRLLFPTPPSSYDVESFPNELIWVPKTLNPKNATPQECIPCIFLTYSSARFLIFYLHSNAEDLGRCHAFCTNLREQFQVHVLAVEYPGYGICPGGPCDERKATENAFVAFRFIVEVLQWPLDSILILGRSIGCGPAISLGVQYQVSGVIVISPMLSVKEACWDAFGPVSYLLDERFPNKDRVSHLRSPFLVVHGQKDVMIPVRHGVELYEACQSRKLLVCPEDMEHNTNLLSHVSYFVLPMMQFFALPDYCFEDIYVPAWVYDKRMSPFYREMRSQQTAMQSLGCLSFPSVPCMSQKPQSPAKWSLREAPKMVPPPLAAESSGPPLAPCPDTPPLAPLLCVPPSRGCPALALLTAADASLDADACVLGAWLTADVSLSPRHRQPLTPDFCGCSTEEVPSVSRAAQLLSPADLADLVEDLERSFAAEEQDSPSPSPRPSCRVSATQSESFDYLLEETVLRRTIV